MLGFISIHKALASLDCLKGLTYPISRISIHKALASLDLALLRLRRLSQISIHKALASLDETKIMEHYWFRISIHKALASLDDWVGDYSRDNGISIHKALASLDVDAQLEDNEAKIFQSTRLSRASTFLYQLFHNQHNISIHKALASLDSKIIQTCSTSPLTFYALCSSLPSSTNSVHSPSPLSQPFPLFFRCESPWHFMSAWHSHLV